MGKTMKPLEVKNTKKFSKFNYETALKQKHLEYDYPFPLMLSSAIITFFPIITLAPSEVTPETDNVNQKGLKLCMCHFCLPLSLRFTATRIPSN